jgi:hypothetical protein
MDSNSMPGKPANVPQYTLSDYAMLNSQAQSRNAPKMFESGLMHGAWLLQLRVQLERKVKQIDALRVNIRDKNEDLRKVVLKDPAGQLANSGD